MPLDLRPYDSLRINQKGIFIVAAGGYCQQFGGHFIARILALLLLLASRRRCSLFSQLFVLCFRNNFIRCLTYYFFNAFFLFTQVILQKDFIYIQVGYLYEFVVEFFYILH